MSDLPLLNKDPDAEVIYPVDWSLRLGADTIINPHASTKFLVPDGLANLGETYEDRKAKVMLGGGTAGQTYTVTSRIKTSGGETLDQSFQLYITD